MTRRRIIIIGAGCIMLALGGLALWCPNCRLWLSVTGAVLFGGVGLVAIGIGLWGRPRQVEQMADELLDSKWD